MKNKEKKQEVLKKCCGKGGVIKDTAKRVGSAISNFAGGVGKGIGSAVDSYVNKSKEVQDAKDKRYTKQLNGGDPYVTSRPSVAPSAQPKPLRPAPTVLPIKGERGAEPAQKAVPATFLKGESGADPAQKAVVKKAVKKSMGPKIDLDAGLENLKGRVNYLKQSVLGKLSTPIKGERGEATPATLFKGERGEATPETLRKAKYTY